MLRNGQLPATCSERTKGRRSGCSGCWRQSRSAARTPAARTACWKSRHARATVHRGTHPDEDEWFYVLEGEFTFYVGDTRLSLPAGSFAFGPMGVPHTFIAGPQGGKALIGFQPFLFEGFLREVGEPAVERVLPPPLEAPPDMERLLPIAARNGMQILGPPGPPPGH